MKTLKIISIAAFSAILSISSFAQSAKEVINNDIPIEFFGIDYTLAKGIELKATSGEIINKYLPSINSLFIKEPRKYNVEKAFNKTKVNIDLGNVNRLNALIDTNKFQVKSLSDVQPISLSDIEKEIKEYNLSGKQGTGLVIFAIILDKPSINATYKYVYFSIPDGKILASGELKGRAAGFGFRNFWASTIYNSFKNL